MFYLLDFLSSYFKSGLLKIIKDKSVCCEIGVWKGDFSKKIIDTIDPKELHLIDPWEFMPTYKKRWYGGTVAKSQDEMDSIYKTVKKRFAGDNVTIHRSTSDKAVKNFKNNFFDFIYVDGDHTYEEVLKDLKNYYPKLKKGGTIAGDDYFWGFKEGLPVRKAVKRFCKEKKLKFRLIGTQFIITKN